MQELPCPSHGLLFADLFGQLHDLIGIFLLALRQQLLQMGSLMPMPSSPIMPAMTPRTNMAVAPLPMTFMERHIPSPATSAVMMPRCR